MLSLNSNHLFLSIAISVRKKFFEHFGLITLEKLTTIKTESKSFMRITIVSFRGNHCGVKFVFFFFIWILVSFHNNFCSFWLVWPIKFCSSCSVNILYGFRSAKLLYVYIFEGSFLTNWYNFLEVVLTQTHVCARTILVITICLNSIEMDEEVSYLNFIDSKNIRS